MNVAGHRICTTEVESALVDHPAVAEAAVVGQERPETGQAIIAFVTLRAGTMPTDGRCSPSCASTSPSSSDRSPGPSGSLFTPDLPKTRSGKIMRRLLRDIAEGRTLGDTTTLADAGIVADLQRRATEEESKEQ